MIPCYSPRGLELVRQYYGEASIYTDNPRKRTAIICAGVLLAIILACVIIYRRM